VVEPRIIGLSGYARSGKDTVGDYLVEHHGFVKVSFAQPMRDALYAMNPLVWVDDLGSWRVQDIVDEFGWDGYKSSLYGQEIRELMQRLGTEVGRKMFGEDFWVLAAEGIMMNHLNDGKSVVFTDVRFPNEAEMIEGYFNGQTWRIERAGVVAANDHPSETALDTHGFYQLIRNDGSLDELYEKVEEALGLI